MDFKNDRSENRKAEFLKTKTGTADNHRFQKPKGKRQNRQKRMVFENYKDRQHWRDKCGFWKIKKDLGALAIIGALAKK